MDTIELKYGDGLVRLDVQDAASVQVLRGNPPPDIADVKTALLRGLEEEMIDSPPLKELVAPTDEVTVVISDLTRFWMRQDLICGHLVDYLLDTLGLPAQNVQVLVALGTHRPLTQAELQKVAGTAFARVKVQNHDALGETVDVGTTSFGTSVKVNPLAVGRKLILVGGTVHHLMSGYGGGRKSILPGIAAKSTIVQNHIRCLSKTQPRSSRSIGVGKLEGNPVHLDMMEAAQMLAPVFSINIAGGAAGPCKLVCGHWRQAFLQSCNLVNAYAGVPIAQQADVVVASCGGYPKDINLYQAVKSLLNAGLAVKEGGDLVLLARCEEGGGAPDFFDWIKPLRQGILDEALRADFTIAGYIFYASIETIRRCGRVLLLTDIAPEEVDGMGMQVFGSADALAEKLNLAGKNVYLMPNAGGTVPCPQ